jgi:hypothetical protein
MEIPKIETAAQPAASFPAVSLPVRQIPTNLSARVLRKNQPATDVHDRHRDLFSQPRLKRNQILSKSKLNVNGNMRLDIIEVSTMATEMDIQRKKRQIKDLIQHELNMVYSLDRVGDWPDSEIGRVYKLSETDVKKIFDNYVELLGTAAGNLCGQEQLRQDPSPELIKKKLRKRRSDARYATRAERQAAYRARLKEKRHPHVQQLPAPSDTDPLQFQS